MREETKAKLCAAAIVAIVFLLLGVASIQIARLYDKFNRSVKTEICSEDIAAIIYRIRELEASTSKRLDDLSSGTADNLIEIDQELERLEAEIKRQSERLNAISNKVFPVNDMEVFQSPGK